MAKEKLKVEEMLETILIKTNELIEGLKTIDPDSTQYGVALDNLGKSFQILSGALLANRGEKQGGK
jgi:hypothetical protein